MRDPTKRSGQCSYLPLVCILVHNATYEVIQNGKNLKVMILESFSLMGLMATDLFVLL